MSEQQLTLVLTDSQREAWRTVRGALTAARRHVLICIAEIGPASIRSVAHELNWETSTVSARMNELKKLGLIEPAFGPDGKQLRTEHIVRGTVTHGSCWQARKDWKDFLGIMQHLWAV